MEKHVIINEQEMFDKIYSMLDENYTLVYVDYRDEIPNTTISECLEKGSRDPLLEKDYYYDTRYYSAKDELKQIVMKTVNNPYTPDQVELFMESDQWRDLIFEIMSRDDSTPEKDAFSHTRTHARVVLHSNYDCWIPLWETAGLQLQGTALNGLIAVLCLNPAKVKASAVKRGIACHGTWRDIRSRNGKEVVDYDDFIDVLIECPNYGLWTFFGTFDNDTLWESDFKTSDMMITNDTLCTMYNSWNGGGSLSQVRTKRAVTLKELLRRGSPYFDGIKVEVDEKNCCNGYSSAEVYGEPLSNEIMLTL